jgi:hypothetical protein
MDFVLQEIAMTSDVASDRHQEIATLGFTKDGGQEFTPFSGFLKKFNIKKLE